MSEQTETPDSAVARATPPPDRLWTSCWFADEGRVLIEGEGKLDLHQRFTISANGVLIEMVCVEWSTPRRWKAQDVDSFVREWSTDPGAEGVGRG